MPLRPARIPPMSGCLSLLAAAAMSACGGGQSTINAPSSIVSFKADGSRTLMDLDPRSADVQGSEVMATSKTPKPGSPGQSASAPGHAQAPEPAPAQAPAPA